MNIYYKLTLLVVARLAHVSAHGVQVAHCEMPNGSLRVFIDQWHGDNAGTCGPDDRVTIQVSVGSSPATLNLLPFKGLMPNTRLANIQGCATPPTLDSFCGPYKDYLNDWAYWDFVPNSCGQTTSVTLIKGNSCIFDEGCANLYPSTISVSSSFGCVNPTNAPTGAIATPAPTTAPTLAPTPAPTHAPTVHTHPPGYTHAPKTTANPTHAPTVHTHPSGYTHASKTTANPTSANIGASPSSAPSFESVSHHVCENYAVHARTTVTFAGVMSTIHGGDVSVSPGTAITGTYSFTDDGAVVLDSSAFAASVVLAHAAAIAVKGNTRPMAIEMGGLTFTPGTYRSGSAINFAYGTVVTLDGLNEPNPVFLFQAGTTLVTAADTYFILKNGAKAENVLWALGTAATLGARSVVAGSILAGTAITFGTQSELQGCALAQSAVTFESEGSVNVAHYSSHQTGPAHHYLRRA
jgi:hypothetical protein